MATSFFRGRHDIPYNPDGDLYFDINNNTYKTKNQEKKLEELEKKLEEKEKKRNNDIKSLIGYFYKSRK